MKKSILVSITMVVLSILACGGSSAPPVVSTAALTEEIIVEQPTATNADTVGAVGDTVTQGNYIVTAVNVETATEFGDLAKASDGNKFVAVELLIESGADSGVFVNPLYISVKDSDGYKYNVTLFGKEPILGSQSDLPKGEKIRGWVTFEVPASATGLILSYEPLTVGNAIRIRFDLGL